MGEKRKRGLLMKLRKIIGIGAIAIGLVLVGFSYYIKISVEAGKEKISHAEKQVGTGEKLFSLSPATKQMSKGLTDAAHEKINEGKEQVAKYTILGRELMIGGFALLVIGIILMFTIYRKGKL